MNLRPFLAATALAIAAFAVGRAWPGPVGVSVVVGFAAAAAVGYRVVERRRVRQLTDRVNSWLAGESTGSASVPRGDAWQQLAVALNALGSAYQRGTATLARERPWRRALVDSLVQPALLFSAEERLLAANGAARRLLGIPVDAVDVTVMQAVGSAPLATAIRDAGGSEDPVTVDTEHADHVLRAMVSRIGDEILMVIADRTQERRVEELRRNFVVNASHELKTPVTSIQTLAEALEVTVRHDPERVAPLVNRLGVEAERLARLVRDLLDLRRLEEGGPLERESVDLATMAREVVADLVPRADLREVELAVEAPEHAIVAGVPGDLETVVKNLVSNGIQYNQPGGLVEVRIVERHDDLELSVRDTGIGIPQQDLGRIFERFYRVDTARSRETGGTGLGLSIVRHAVERHGGSIRVDSLLAQGTTFTVTLPRARAGVGEVTSAAS